MKGKSLGIVAGTAALTVAAVKLDLFPRHRIATANEGEEAVLEPRTPLRGLSLTPPVLRSGGVEYSLAAEDESPAANEKPRVTLRATNTTAGTVELEVRIELMGFPPPNPLSRVVLPPQSHWSDMIHITLNAEETEAFTIAPDVTLEGGREYFFTLRAGDDAILALTFSVPPMES